MKIALISDLHLGFNTVSAESGFPENPEIAKEFIIESTREIKQSLLDNPPDILVVAGDVFHSNIVDADSLKVALEFFLELSEHSEIIVVSGNHDGEYLKVLESIKGLRLYTSDAEAIRKLIKEPKMVEIGGIRFLPLPFPSKQLSNYFGILKNKYEELLTRLEYDFVVGHRFVRREFEAYNKTLKGINDVYSPSSFYIDESKIKGIALLGHIHILTIEENYIYPSSPLPPPFMNKTVYPDSFSYVVIDSENLSKKRVRFEGIKRVIVNVRKTSDLANLFMLLKDIKRPRITIRLYDISIQDAVRKELASFLKSIGKRAIVKINIKEKIVSKATLDDFLLLEEDESGQTSDRLQRTKQLYIESIKRPELKALARDLFKIYEEYSHEDDDTIRDLMRKAIEDRARKIAGD